MRRFAVLLFLILFMLLLAMDSNAIQRFPKPEFENGHVQPKTLLPFPRAEALIWMDVAVLLLSLSVVTWLVLKKRSRMSVFLFSVFSLFYFGFYRQGCVCPIGSIQNVTLALADHSYVLPLTILIFFLAPLIFTLLFGRTFCAGVCPFGALQDMVSFKPMRMGPGLNAILGLIPYLYLGLAVTFAATGTDFIICRYDPFIGIFRLNAPFNMFIFGGILLLSGVFIARPYCRFLCPYGVLLNWLSRFSWKHMGITPSECIQCRLCENSCPYDAIDLPKTEKSPEGRKKQLRQVMVVTLLLPFMILVFGWAGSRLNHTFAGANSRVRLSRMIQSPAVTGMQPEIPEITAFRSTGISVRKIIIDADKVESAFYTWGWIFGGFAGLVLGLTILGLLRSRYHTDYVPDKGSCFSCARCVDYCPVKPNEVIKQV
jgi:ferredoxin